MSYTIEVRTINPQPVVCVRTHTSVAGIGPALAEGLARVVQYLEQRGVKPAGPPYSRYHASPAEGVELEAGFAVPAPVPGQGQVLAGELPGGQVSVTTHHGSYEHLRDAYRAMGIWLKEHGMKMAGPPWELYWSDPSEEPDASRWRTEIFWPVAAIESVQPQPTQAP